MNFSDFYSSKYSSTDTLKIVFPYKKTSLTSISNAIIDFPRDHLVPVSFYEYML
jgi:hypothetical protein